MADCFWIWSSNWETSWSRFKRSRIYKDVSIKCEAVNGVGWRPSRHTCFGSSPMRSAIPCSRRSRSSWMYLCSSNNILVVKYVCRWGFMWSDKATLKMDCRIWKAPKLEVGCYRYLFRRHQFAANSYESTDARTHARCGQQSRQSTRACHFLPEFGRGKSLGGSCCSCAAPQSKLSRRLNFQQRIPLELLFELASTHLNHIRPSTIHSTPSLPVCANSKIKMAEGGIDRKADEKLTFSTSKEVTVHPTFESMSLKGRISKLERLR